MSSALPPSLVRAARQMIKALQHETALARLGSLADLAKAAADKEAAMREFAAACAARGQTAPATGPERDELRHLLAAADENALILEAVGSTLGDLAAKVRSAATATLDPGTYDPAGRNTRHVSAAYLDSSV